MKQSVEQLALLGGAPAFAEKLHVGRPNIGDRARLMARIEDMLDRRWLSNNGPFVQELERRIAEMVGVRHCVAMCNATVALEIAIRALGMSGEVIVPSYTFVATPHALQWQQITPVFCDVDPRTHNIDPSRVEALITPRTTGVVGVHVWGTPCDVDALAEIAEAVGDRTEVLVDGGIRHGADVVRALALGARAVMIGRPWVWALAQGQAGVARMLDLLRTDIDRALRLLGCPSVGALDRSYVRYRPPTWKEPG